MKRRGDGAEFKDRGGSLYLPAAWWEAGDRQGPRHRTLAAVGDAQTHLL